MARPKRDVRLTISTDDVDRMASELEDDLNDVIDESARELRGIGLEAAKDHIRKHDKVWTNEVLNSWVPLETTSIGGAAGVTLYGFQNFADHAGVVNDGATYTDKKPPVDALMPYVISEMTPFPGMDYTDMAFWLQQTIFDNGIEGINYTGKAKTEMENQAQSVLRKNARKNL